MYKDNHLQLLDLVIEALITQFLFNLIYSVRKHKNVIMIHEFSVAFRR